MSTTMQAHIEVKKDGQWHHFAAPSIDKNYYIGAVTGGEQLGNYPGVKPVARIKQLPEDISLVTRVCYEQDLDSGHFFKSPYNGLNWANATRYAQCYR